MNIDLNSEISLPLESLHGLLLLMQDLLKHKFVAGLCGSYFHSYMRNFVGVMSVASSIMALHHEEVLLMNNSCLIPFLKQVFSYMYVHNVKYFLPDKSTAIQCALSVCEQNEVSHLIKTKATPDSICMERIIKSTLPFSLDDPKISMTLESFFYSCVTGGSKNWAS